VAARYRRLPSHELTAFVYLVADSSPLSHPLNVRPFHGGSLRLPDPYDTEPSRQDYGRLLISG
jgi:hypothetical protein